MICAPVCRAMSTMPHFIGSMGRFSVKFQVPSGNTATGRFMRRWAAMACLDAAVSSLSLRSTQMKPLSWKNSQSDRPSRCLPTSITARFGTIRPTTGASAKQEWLAARSMGLPGSGRQPIPRSGGDPRGAFPLRWSAS